MCDTSECWGGARDCGQCATAGVRAPCSTGHKGKFGHEFMEFEFRPDGRLRYANNSNYKNDVMIRKECASFCCKGG